MRFLFTILICFILADALCHDPNDSTIVESSKKVRLRNSLYIPIQYAGNIGFLSTGIGYGSRKDKYQLSLLYGYAPRSMAGIQIHTVTAKNIFPIYRFYLKDKHLIQPYGGIAVSFELGGRSFFWQPDIMDKGYYDYPKSMHFIASAGIKSRPIIKHQIKGLRGIEFYAETCAVDANIWYKVMSNEVRMTDILTLALGVHLIPR